MATESALKPAQNAPRLPYTSDDGSADAVVDEAAAGSFPASDPAAPGVARRRQQREELVAHERATLGTALDAALDDALDDTFPASDPVALAQSAVDPD